MSGERRYRELLKSLRDDNVGTVVIYGMGGIGKTWIAKQGFDHAMAAHLFDIFIWVPLSITCNTRHARLKILHNLSIPVGGDVDGLDDQESSISRGNIAAFLADKKFLLVLDDAWFTTEQYPLELIGIPRPNHGSKVIVTTRTRRTKSVMDPDVVIEPDSLSQRESWELFLERSDRGSSTSPHLSTVINKCTGIPLSIILIAGALRLNAAAAAASVDHEDPLKSASLALGINSLSIYTTMDRAARFSYNMLPGSTARHILLYCMLFPGDIGISVHDLVRYWIIDGLLLDLRCKTWQEAYAKGWDILTTLLNHGLLYKEEDGRIRMHDVVREVAFDIGRSSGFCKRYSLKQQVAANLPEFMSVSFDGRDIVSLMDGTLMGENLPELFWVSTLLLRGNSLLKVIPDAFFRPMSLLRVLDLSFTGIRLLPSSISWLVSLQYLLLRECESLEEMQHISSLKNLEVLDVSGSKSLRTIGSESFEHMNWLNVLNLSGTPVEHLPPLYGLHELRQLYLSGCQCLKSIPHLESLNKLELLDISNTTFARFPRDVLKLSQLKFLNLVGLKYTTVEGAVIQCLPGSIVPIEPLGRSDNKVWLSVSIAKFSSLHKHPMWENCLHKFHLCVSPSEENLDNVVLFQRMQAVVSATYLESRQIAHSTGHNQHLEIQCIESYPFGIEGILNHAELVSFNKVVFMKRLSDIGLGNMKTVKECRIERCSQVECVFYGEEVEIIAAFGSLENLWISNLQNLQFVCGGMESVMSFNCLKHLYIDCCPNLVTLFDSTLHLEHLETLEIKFCNQLESVFKEPVQGEDALPRLQTLRLWELPELKSICRGILPTLNNLKVKECPKLKKLPLGVTDMSPIVRIKGDKSWWSNMVIEDERIRPFLLFRKWERF